MGEMINANELMIGNFIYREKSKIGKIEQIAPYITVFDKLEPIPITEEWLTKKFIFKQIDKYTFVLNGIFIHKRLSGFIFNIGKRKIKLNSIQQLQNLYFALTKKELTLNE